MAKKDKKIDPSRRNFLFGSFRRLKKEDPEQHVALTEETIPLIQKASAAYATKKFEEAIPHYREYLKSEKTDLDARFRLGVCLYHIGKQPQARVELKRVLNTRKKDEQAMLYLGLSQLRSGKVELALEAWKDYFDTSNVALLREINVQRGMLENGEIDHNESADAVEVVLSDS